MTPFPDPSEFTYWCTPWSVAWGKSVHLIWSWKGRKELGAIYYVEWTPKSFGRKTRLYDQPAEELDVAIDPDSGRIVVVFSDYSGVFVSSRPCKGPWTKPSRLRADLKEKETVLVKALGKQRFLVRVGVDKPREFVLKPK